MDSSSIEIDNQLGTAQDSDNGRQEKGGGACLVHQKSRGECGGGCQHDDALANCNSASIHQISPVGYLCKFIPGAAQ